MLGRSHARACCCDLATELVKTGCVLQQKADCSSCWVILSLLCSRKECWVVSHFLQSKTLLCNPVSEHLCFSIADLQTPENSLSGYFKCLSELQVEGMQVHELYSIPSSRILTGVAQLTGNLGYIIQHCFRRTNSHIEFWQCAQKPPSKRCCLTREKAERGERSGLLSDDASHGLEQSLSHYLRISHFKYCNK